MDWKINKGKIISNDGIPVLPRCFCDDRTEFEIDSEGIKRVQYFNEYPSGTVRVLEEDMFGGIKFYIKDEGRLYKQNIKECTVMPYGFLGAWEHKNQKIEYVQRVVDNTIYIGAKCSKNTGLKLVMEMYDNMLFRPFAYGDCRFTSETSREWGEWTYSDGILENYYEENGNRTFLKIGTVIPNTYTSRGGGFKKRIVEIDISNKEFSYFRIAFGTHESIAYEQVMCTNPQIFFENQDKRYEAVAEKSPVLKSPYRYLNDFFSLAPMYQEANKVISESGAVRAKTEFYWVWGWDGMTSAYAYSYWGDSDFIGRLLDFYMRTADKEKGICHAYERNMNHGETSVAAAQGFYLNMMNIYMENGGDVAPYYDFAKKIFNMMISYEVGNTGLCEGSSLFPDDRAVMLENGHDISAYNNSSMYCAARAMEKVAEHMGDEALKKSDEEFAKRTRDNFMKLLWDSEKKYICSSASSESFEKRKVYSSLTIKWDNKFCRELIGENMHDILEVYENNFLSPKGIRAFALWDQAWDGDSNQGHCWWPPLTEMFCRAVNSEDRNDLMEKWINWVCEWAKRLTCPEAVDCYTESDVYTFDKWNSKCGAWQSFTIRAWYEAIVHSVIGVDFDEKGIAFYPYSGEEISVEGLHYANRIYNISMKDSGKNIEKIILNGKEYKNNGNTIAYESLDKVNNIEVYRKK